MFSRNTYISIIVQIILIVLIALASIQGIVQGRAIILGIIGLVLVVFQVVYLANWLNTTNRRIKLFFDTIENEESMLVFPEINGSKEQIELNKTFNRINNLIARIKWDNLRKEQFYKALLEQVPGGVILWDETGKVRFVNHAALCLLGCTHLSYYYQLEKTDPDFHSHLKEAIAKGSAIMKITDEWVKRQLIIAVNQVVVGDERFTLLSLQDIDESLNKKEDESWGRLTHVLTHEIMNSIAPIVSLSKTLTSYYETNGSPKPASEITDLIVGKTLRGLETVKTQGSGLINFTNSYRRLSFMQMPAIKPYSLTSQFQKLKELMIPELAASGIAFSVEIYPSEIELNADETLIYQVILNLLKNAIQALEGVDEGKIRLSARVAEKVFIEVADNGPGIAPELAEDIFVPFFTTKVTGSGIGLSLSKQIIRRHRGQLLMKSKPFDETSFIIVLPF